MDKSRTPAGMGCAPQRRLEAVELTPEQRARCRRLSEDVMAVQTRAVTASVGGPAHRGPRKRVRRWPLLALLAAAVAAGLVLL